MTLGQVRYQLEPHGIALELGRVGHMDPEVRAFIEGLPPRRRRERPEASA